MIVFGARAKTIAGPLQRGVSCPACRKDEHTTYGILRYFHVFFIPVFPFKKEVATQCLHCRKTLGGAELPESLRTDIARQVFTPQRILPSFTGLFIGALLILFIVVVGGGESRKQAAYLASPAAGDYYVVRAADVLTAADPKHPYAVMQVAGISANQLELRVGATYTTSLSALKAIRTHETSAPTYFGTTRVKLPMATLPSLKARGTIDSVKRL